MNKQNRSREVWKKISPVLGFVIGIAILIVLIWQTGFSDFKEAINKGGVALLLLTLFYPFEVVSRGYAWKWVYPGHKNLPPGYFMWSFWYAQSMNILVPTATIGGDILRGDYLIQRDGEVTAIITSLLADKTIHGIATVLMLITGLLLLLTKHIKSEFIYVIIGLSVALAVGVYVFIRIQRSGKVSGVLKRMADNKTGFFSIAKIKSTIIQKRLDKIYTDPGIMLKSIIVRFLGDVIMAGEVWLAAWLMNTPITIIEAITLRLISYGVRYAAFFVWGGLGIQESMYALLSAFVGLSPSLLIVISLATRSQEIITAILGGGTWMAQKSYHNFKKSDSQTAENAKHEES